MVENEQSRQGTGSENVDKRVTSPPSPPLRHVKWKMARIKKSGAPNSEQSQIIIENPWLSKAPKLILYLKVVTISWLKQLDDLRIVVVFVQLEKGLGLNYISELHHDTHPIPPP